MLTGPIDLLQIPKSNKPTFVLALNHGIVNGIIILALAEFAYQVWQSYPK